MDSFDPRDFGPQPNQRIATVLVYLSNVTLGGETVFKREGVHGIGIQVRGCALSLRCVHFHA
jgi:prolyl 4-hydroxylase